MAIRDKSITYLLIYEKYTQNFYNSLIFWDKDHENNYQVFRITPLHAIMSRLLSKISQCLYQWHDQNAQNI